MSSLEFKFSTALSSVNPETGSREGAKLEAIAKQIRGRVMSQQSGDGITGMWIERYGMRVEYFSDIITAKQVDEAVNEAFAWLIRENKDAFPLLPDPKNKVVELVTTGRHEGQPDTEASVEAIFRTNLYEYPASNAVRENIHEELAEELLQLRGVRNLTIFIDRLVISVIQELTSAEDVKSHIEKVLSAHAANPDSKFMPYIKNQPLYIAWNVEE